MHIIVEKGAKWGIVDGKHWEIHPDPSIAPCVQYVFKTWSFLDLRGHLAFLHMKIMQSHKIQESKLFTVWRGAAVQDDLPSTMVVHSTTLGIPDSTLFLEGSFGHQEGARVGPGVLCIHVV